LHNFPYFWRQWCVFVFQSNGKRKQTDVRTAAGTEFQGVLEMTQEEWVEVGRQVRLLLPPITTTYNGVIRPPPTVAGSANGSLPTVTSLPVKLSLLLR